MFLVACFFTLMAAKHQSRDGTNWNRLFGRDNEFRAMQLEMDLSFLIPDEHASIEDYLTKFKSLIARLKGCGKTKSDSECIFLILFKLKGPYHVFCFSFYSTMDELGDDFKMPTFELFCERLTRKQSKIQQLAVALSSSETLVAHNLKGKPKAHSQKKKNSTQASESPSKTT